MVGITLKNVTKRFGSTVAVDDVSLHVERGELFFLLGPSGCGKTTLLRAIAGLCEPNEGEIYFDDRPMGPVPAHKRNTALVFQNYALWPHKTVAENVAYGLEERRIPRSKRHELVQEALRGVRLEEYAQRSPNQLSGGQQQRVALARALVIQPDVVLLDEPLSNLDARLRLEMRYEIRRIHDETGITMVYVTHDQKEALTMADRIAVMSMGRVEQIGDPRSLYRYPANRFVATFIGETNLFPGQVVSVEGEWARVQTALGQFRVRRGSASTGSGDQVDCMVRPTCLRLDGEAENAFRATLSKSVYLGELEEFLLDADGQAVRALAGHPGENPPRPGAQVDVSFSAEDAVLLPAEPEETKT